MAMVQVDEDQLKLLATARNLLAQLTDNPKTKRRVEAAIKELHPQVQTSDELAEPYVKPLQEKIDALEKRLQEDDDRKVTDRYMAQFGALKDQGFTDDGVEKIKKMMVDRNIPDVDAAVALFERQNPKQPEAPQGLRSNAWTLGDAETDKDKMDRLMKDETQFARDEAVTVLNEFRANSFGQPPVRT